MQSSRFKIQNLRFLFCILHFAFCIISINAQSTDQNFPTAVTEKQITGTIKARDLGDSRLTTYFYVFGGEQGDIFLNVVTKNFDGDIDVFTLNGLKPLTKIRVFSDSSDNETGRIVYLRQPEKLLLRIEGRTPNDDPATFQIKFAGSFIAEKNSTKESDAPQVKSENQGEVKVNSVGTIIQTKPKPTPKPSETTEETEKAETSKEKKENAKETPKVEAKTVEKVEDKKEVKPKKEETKKLEVVITDNLEKPKEEKAKTETQEKTEETKTEEKTETKKEEVKTEETPKKEINPLENIKLTVIFKDGRKIERTMNDILSVNVDKGILTIIEKDGTISRFSILEIVEFTIK